MSKSKELMGKVRINIVYEQEWHGFILQRGHFYGQMQNGVYFVSGLDRNARNKNQVKVYLCNTSNGDYVWKAEYMDINDPLIQDMIKAIPERTSHGIQKVEFRPLQFQEVHFHQRLTSGNPYPYRPMHIPNAGRPRKTTFLTMNGTTRIIQNYS